MRNLRHTEVNYLSKFTSLVTAGTYVSWLHSLHSLYSLASQDIKISSSMLSWLLNDKCIQKHWTQWVTLVSTQWMFFLSPAQFIYAATDTQKRSVSNFLSLPWKEFSLLQRPYTPSPLLLPSKAFYTLAFLFFLWYAQFFPLHRLLPLCITWSSIFPSLKILPLIQHPSLASALCSVPLHNQPDESFHVLPSQLFF